jgi:hypothetical protein
MKEKIKFKMGSSYFFSSFEDYKVKDTDILCIMDGYSDTIKSNVLNMKLNGEDVFFYRDLDKSGFIKDTIESKVPMRVGKFLIPEFCKYIGFTIDDYELLKDVFDSLDEKHSYEKLIRDAYIENGDFVLTDEQRKRAYEEYKEKRKPQE